ncbi:hypothetical protein RB599_004544 [Gaeumannomyces hyphopodioides]
MSDPNNYTVGWICAISTEYIAAQCFLDDKHDQPAFVAPHDGNDYTLGRMGRHNVVIAVLPDGEYGTNSAAVVARDMLHSFPNVRIGLMVGIGGGAPSSKNDIRLGDIAVSSPSNGKGGVLQYDMGKAIQGQGFQQSGFLNKPPLLLSTAVNGLKAQYAVEGHKIVETIEKILAQKKRLKKTHGRPDPSTDRLYISTKIHEDPTEDCHSTCRDEERDLIMRRERDVEEGDDDPAIFYGLIASANRVMKDATLRDLLALDEDVLCFEMEAAGLMNHFPCLVVRGICDYSDSHKSKAWQGYAAMTAAAYTKDLLNRIPPNKIEAEKKISEVLSDEDVVHLRHDVKVLGSKLDTKEDQTILDWVAPNDYGSQQTHNMRRWQPGTGQWLLNLETFITWLDGRGQSLFCRGMPGAGKTILAAVVVNHLLSQRAVSDDGCAIGVAFLYCNFSRRETQGPEDMLSSVLKHLSQGLQSLPESVRRLYQTHKAAGTRPLLHEIVACLESVIGRYKKTFIIIDALDECPTDCRSRLLPTLFQLRDAQGINLFATSRPSEEIERRFPRNSVLEIEADVADVKLYLDEHMSAELPDFVCRQPDLKNLIKEAISEAARGMFLLAHLYLRSLANKPSRREIEVALADKNMTYEKLYEDTAQRIMHSGHAEFAKKALSWVVCAKRPVSPSELLHALAVNPGDRALDRDNIPEMGGVISACAGLVTVDEESNAVRLIHYTAHEYLANGSGHSALLPGAEAYVAGVCTTYLSFDEFEEGFCRTHHDFETRLSTHSFYLYAANNWGYHVSEASLSQSDDSSLRIFLSSASRIESATQAVLTGKKWGRWGFINHSQAVPSGVTGLHLAAYFGATNVISDLLGRLGTEGCNVQDSGQRTPLTWAVEMGNVGAVQILLNSGADPNLRDCEFMAPLDLAANYGFADIVDALLKWEERTGSSQTGEVRSLTLFWAAFGGRANVVEMLLARWKLEEEGISLALRGAIRGESETIVKMILEATLPEAGEDWRDTRNRLTPTLLRSAAVAGRVPIFAYLLSALGGEIDCQDVMGMTPLMYAAKHGHYELAGTLLGHGADPSISNRAGQTAVLLAAENRHDAVVDLFLPRTPATAGVDAARD